MLQYEVMCVCHGHICYAETIAAAIAVSRLELRKHRAITIYDRAQEIMTEARR